MTTIKTAGLLLVCALASRAQENPTRRTLANVSAGALAEGVPLVAIGSAGIDPEGLIGHVQGIARISPAPAGQGGAPVMTGSVIGPSVTYTCDSTINAVAGVCTALNTTIASLYTSRFTNVDVSIYIKFGSTGLGMSNYVINSAPYSTFRTALGSDLTDANDVTAFDDSVPATNPINASYSVWLTNANARALGFSATTGIQSDGATFCAIGSMGCYDGIITVSSAQQSAGHLFFRSGMITGSQYDFYSVVEHETDEVLGTASCAFGSCSSAISPADVFRYSSNGTRSFAAGNNNPCSSSNSGNACFSLDGVHMLQRYNNLNNGEDAGDWFTNCPSPLVQDAVGCLGVAGVDISPAAEILVLDVVGYNLTVLEPTMVSPAFGSGLTQSFAFTFNAPYGFASLTVLDVLINNVLDGIGACYVALVPASATTGTVYLVDDAGDAGGPFAGTMSLPGTGTVQNSQCSIAGTGSSVNGSGNSLTMTLVITFKAPFAGNKVLYVAAQDNTLSNSGWQTIGTWNVPGSVPSGPAVGGVSPGHGSSAIQTYTFTFTDTNGFADLSVLDVLINNAIDGIGACYMALVPSGPTAGTVYLVDDGGDAGGPFAGNVTLPGSGNVANSQCSISGTGSSVSSSSNTLTLVLNMTFNPAFGGNRVVYMAARSNALNSGWQAAGTVNVPY